MLVKVKVYEEDDIRVRSADSQSKKPRHCGSEKNAVDLLDGSRVSIAVGIDQRGRLLLLPR